MYPGKSLRLKALLLVSLLLLQAGIVLACAAGKHQPHCHAAHRQVNAAHTCCNQVSVQLLQTDGLTVALSASATLPAPARLLSSAPAAFSLRHNPTIVQPSGYKQYILHRPIPDIRIAIQSFQI